MGNIAHLLQQEKHYLRLFGAGIVNGIGDRFSQVALLSKLLELTGSGWAVGAVLAIRVFPFFLFGPLGGKLADQFSRKNILIITDLSRIIFAISLAFANSADDMWLIYISTFMLAAGEAIYAPARKSWIPLLVKKDHIIKINSLEQVMLGIVLIGGSLFGGIVAFYFGTDLTFWLNGLSFLLAAFMIASIPFVHRKREPDKEKRTGIFHSIQTIKKLVIASAALYIVCLFKLIVPLFNGIDNVLISIYAIQEFHLGDIGVGLFYGALGVGLMLSFMISQRITQHLLFIGLAALIIEGIGLMVLSHVYLAWIACLLYIFISFASGICNTCMDSIVMQETPVGQQGFVFGWLVTVSNTFIGISMFTTGIMLKAVSNRMLGLLGGLGFVLTGLFLAMVYWTKQKKRMMRKESFDTNSRGEDTR
ncbi:MFS transporter [Anoxybacteroides rupiense]|uniref:MFS transporter n=1 Tax=Anoxybacteroides rupiense TaxID=311460 RepID=UPI003FA6136C